MLTLEVIAHAWLYSRLTALHLSSYVLAPPQACRAIVTVYHCPDEDPETAAMLAYFSDHHHPENVRWNFQSLPRPQLCRRAIGRNMACRASAADFILLSDIDYIFGAGALDEAAAKLTAANADGPKLCWPRKIQASVSHEDGDAEIERVVGPGVYPLKGNYEGQILAGAIGGAQWLHGDWAREHGYLPNDPRYQAPVESWNRTWEDPAFRRRCGIPQVFFRVPNVFRVRHGKRGRVDTGVRL